MFTITIGRENTACPSLSERIYDEISEAVRRGKTNLYLVVNQAATFESEGNLMDRFRVNGIMNHLGAEGFVDVEVISFTRLVARVLSLAGGAGSIPGTVLGTILIILIDNVGTQFGIGSFVMQVVTGFVIVIGIVIDQLKKRGTR